MDMKMKQTVDVSPFMLFEATGDSEADCDLIMDEQVGYEMAGAHHHYDHDDDDNDDAQSCSYDGSETQNCNLGEHLLGYGSCDPDYEHDAEKKKDDEEEDEEACVYYGTSYCDDDDEIRNHHSSSVSVESGQHLMDEMEKNRRFWEACLAS